MPEATVRQGASFAALSKEMRVSSGSRRQWAASRCLANAVSGRPRPEAEAPTAKG